MRYTARELRYAIDKSKIENIYLFNGVEVGEKKEVIESLKKKIFNDKEPVVYTYYCDDSLDNVELLDTLQTNLLFSDKKIIILKGVDNISNDTIAVIEKFLLPFKINKYTFENDILGKLSTSDKKLLTTFYASENDYYKLLDKIKKKDKVSILKVLKTAGYFVNSDSYLIMLNDTNEKVPDSLTDILLPEQVVTFWEMFENQKVEWVKNYIKSRGLYITDSAINFILEMIPNSTDQLRDEIDKIVALYQELGDKSKKYIELDFIEDYLEFSKEESVFSLYSSILIGNSEKAIMILLSLFNSDDFSLLSGFLWSHKRFLRAVDLYENQRVPVEQIFNNLKIFSKRTQEEFKIGFERYDFYYLSKVFYELLELDYYLKLLPDQLKLIKLQQFVINFLNKNKMSDIFDGEIELIEF